VLTLLPDDRCLELQEHLGFTPQECQEWDRISRKMRLAFHDDGIISQFEGYGDLEEFDWEGYRKAYGDIHRLDRILESEGDSPNRYKLSKQADVLMLFYLFSADELGALFNRLGYAFPGDLIPRNIEYYIARTSHGSTLSRVVHSWVLCRADRERSWRLFTEALASDVEDVQGGTTAEGIHLGAMAGTVDLLQRCYTGIEVRDDVLYLHPRLPQELAALHLDIRYCNQSLALDITSNTLKVRRVQGTMSVIRLCINDTLYHLDPDETKTFQW
jgi:alpha,alpha-trehalase